jgi:hypothetical protein
LAANRELITANREDNGNCIAEPPIEIIGQGYDSFAADFRTFALQ